MRAVIRKIGDTIKDDPLFLRVSMGLVGAGIMSILSWGVTRTETGPTAEWWLWAILALIAAFGCVLLAVALVASDDSVNRWADLLGDGGDVAAVVVLLGVAFIALPATVLIRVIKPRRPAEQNLPADAQKDARR